jgi:hypothetical protein
MSIQLKKINPSCNNIELIDSNECIGDSLKKINNAFEKFKEIQRELSNVLINNLEFRSFFNTVSSKMVSTALLIDSINNIYQAPYTTIQVLSAKWNSKELTYYFPELIGLEFYKNDTNNYNTIIVNYFNEKYNSSNYPENQIVNIYISLTYTNVFDFIFSGSYVERCSPIGRSANTLTCNGCGGDNRNAGCNIQGQTCRNAYSFCRTSTTSQTFTYECLGTILDTYVYESNITPPLLNAGNTGFLSINYNSFNNEDMFIARVIKLKIKKQGGTWNIVT